MSAAEPAHQGSWGIAPRPATGGAAAAPWWAADGHVHSTFSDGASTLREDLDAAEAVGLARITLVDHVRAGTTWVPELVRAVDGLRDQAARAGSALDIRCGVEVKVLDRTGRLDLPTRLEGVDVILIADHRFPGPDGPLDPEVVARWLGRGSVDVRNVLELVLGALLEAVTHCPAPAVLAHPLSILPKLGLREGQVPPEWLHALALRCRATGTALEVNEKWACPGVDVVRLFHETRVEIVAGSDAHHASAVGRWSTVGTTLAEVLGPAPAGIGRPRPVAGVPGGQAEADVVPVV